ncbi:hypothetical protein [Hymenobacter lutimineralis]|uniref:hypothetical protein n=1 Tax=Hymenobacter lutimineralis TaxID=2606448 RepID=UPI001654EF28|nr:hypothetical protein [Hymenobacter lutimineralis]
MYHNTNELYSSCSTIIRFCPLHSAAMKALTLCLAVSCLATTALAQTKPAAKSTAKPAAARTTTTTAKPAAKPAAAKPTTTTAKPVATARPATESAAPAATAKPTATKAAAPAKESSASASIQTFGKGSTVANLGLGVGLGYGYGLLGGTGKSIPALSLSVERGMYEGLGPGVIGVGAMVGYKAYTWRSGDYKATWSNIYVGVRGTYHYNFTDNEKLDTYAGLALGARIENYSDNYGYADSNAWGGTYVTSGLFLGARYYVTDKIGAFAEAGYDMSYLKIGASVRF